MTSQTRDFEPYVERGPDGVDYLHYEGGKPYSLDDFLDHMLVYKPDGDVEAVVWFKHIDNAGVELSCWAPVDTGTPAELKNLSLGDLMDLRINALKPLGSGLRGRRAYRVDDCRADSNWSYFVLLPTPGNEEGSLFVLDEVDMGRVQPVCRSVEELLALLRRTEHIEVQDASAEDMSARFSTWVDEGRVVVWNMSDPHLHGGEQDGSILAP